MDNKPRPKPNQGSSWENEHEKMTNPNRRQDEETNVESQRGSNQRASNSDVGSSESTTSDSDEQLHRGRQGEEQYSDTSRRTRQTEE